MGLLEDVRNYFARLANLSRMKRALRLELGALVTAEPPTPNDPTLSNLTPGKLYGVLGKHPVYSSSDPGTRRLENVLFNIINDRTVMQQLPCSYFRY